MKAPKVSVVMPVFNAAAFVRTALDSILTQTFSDFELIVVDDGSTDDSLVVLDDYACRDSRLRVIQSDVNVGVATSLNVGLDAARGEYICRMDADDISRRERLARQVTFLDQHQNIGVLGTATRCFGPSIDRRWALPASDNACRARLLFSVPVAHPTAMIRRCILEEHGFRYQPQYKHAEDYDLWERMMDFTQFANLREVLLDYRCHDKSASKTAEAAPGLERFEVISSIFSRLLRKLGIQLTRDEAYVHYCLGFNDRVLKSGVRFDQYARHIQKLNTLKTEPAIDQYSMRALMLRRFVMVTYLLTLADSEKGGWRALLSFPFWRESGRVARSFFVR